MGRLKKFQELTCSDTVNSNCLKAGELLFASSGEKVSCSLNPKLILGASVGVAVVVVVGAPAIVVVLKKVTFESMDVPCEVRSGDNGLTVGEVMLGVLSDAEVMLTGSVDG